jgi:hypothetical protein
MFSEGGKQKATALFAFPPNQFNGAVAEQRRKAVRSKMM